MFAEGLVADFRPEAVVQELVVSEDDCGVTQSKDGEGCENSSTGGKQSFVCVWKSYAVVIVDVRWWRRSRSLLSNGPRWRLYGCCVWVTTEGGEGKLNYRPGSCSKGCG